MKEGSVFSRLPYLLLCAAVSIVAGCTNFDYIGRSFAPLPETHKVTIFRERDAMQEGKYTMIGRGVFTAPESYDRYDLEESLGELAREHGADAVLIVKTRTFLRSFNVPESGDGFAAPSSIRGNPSNTAPNGSPLAENSFGQQVPETYGGETTLRPKKQYYGRKIVEASVIFYRNTAEMREMQQIQEKTISEAASRSASDYRPLTSPEPAPKPEKDDALPE